MNGVNGASSPSPSRWPDPLGTTGTQVAVLVNANAKRGGRRVAAQIGRALPSAKVRLTKSTDEIDVWLRGLPDPSAIFAAGGDGTAMALMNALARVTPVADPLPAVGVLPLGTGNAWAHALGAPKLHDCLELHLRRARRPLPTRRCGLVEVEGRLAHFAGSGWDAMILEDFRRQLAATKGPGRRLTKSVYGYVAAALLRTAPRVLLSRNPHVVIENLGDEVFAIDPDGKPQKLEGRGHGAVLYDAPAGIAGAGTCPEFGYRFKAFPFAERMPGFIHVRAYSRGPFDAFASLPMLWSGAHPVDGMHDWLVTHARMTFSRPVSLQIAGDAQGMRRTIEFRSASRSVSMVDWRRLLSP